MSATDDLVEYARDMADCETWTADEKGYTAERVRSELQPLLDAYRDQILREAAAKLREWGQDGPKRLARDENDLPLFQSPFYMWEDADRAANLIDPDRKPS